MDTLFSLAGVVGGACCVGMYAAVSLGHASPERPLYFIVNGLGAALVMASAWHEFDIGDLGTILQEIVWIALSIVGIVRVWRAGRERRARSVLAANRPVLHAVRAAAERTDPVDGERTQDFFTQRAAPR